MKKQMLFLLAAAILCGVTAGAAVREEWTFEKDVAGTLLANSINFGIDGGAFASGGNGILEADGLGYLLSTPSNTNLWGDGVTLDANLTVSTNVLYLRYDLNYDFTSLNTDGTTIGIYFVDGTGTNVAGMALTCKQTGKATALAGKTLTQVNGASLGLSGTLSAIARVDLSGSPSMTVWYDSTGGNSFTEASPAKTVAVSLSSISDLRIQATGTASGAADNFVAVENIRVADSWADISVGVEDSVEVQYFNEWMFDHDVAGRTLSQATNSGTDKAAFSADATPVTQTDGLRSLICSNEIAGIGNLWTNGAILRADVTNQSSGVRFLRYDLTYDMTATENNSGTLLGLAFADTTSTNLAGVALKCTTADSVKTPPTGISAMSVTNLMLSGYLAVIVQIDLDNHEMSVWYDLSGANSFNASNQPNVTVTNLALTSIKELEFRATGDFIASASNECVVIDNIRTATTWAEITKPPVNLRAPPKLNVSIGASLGDVLVIGQTNLISITIQNSGGPATRVSSTLTHNGAAGLSIISSNNTEVSLDANGSVIQTYEVVANADGPYVLTAQATSAETNSALATYNLYVGPKISFKSYTLTNEVGGAFLGEVEQGESFDLIITSVNDGSGMVTGITNSLTAVNPAYFPTIIPSNSATYASLAKNATTSTTYRVVCSATAPKGLQTFTVVNSTTGRGWTNQFSLNVFKEARLSAPTNLTLRVAPGETNSASITVTNTGNGSSAFTVTDDGRRPTVYTDEPDREARQTFGPIDFNPATVFEWGTATTTPMAIGFNFPLFGTTYDTFSVSENGFITLSSTNGGGTATVQPFQIARAIDHSTIRYRKMGDKLVVAWGYTHYIDGSDTELEFQAWINTNGTIQYLYESGTWETGTIGLHDSNNSQVFTHTPGLLGQDAILLAPAPWVTYVPTEGAINGFGGTQTLTFTADATRQTASGHTNVFTTSVNCDGRPISITVTVIIENKIFELNVPPTFVFGGAAGSISPAAIMTITNSGNVALTYTITDNSLKTAGYTMSAPDYNNNWRDGVPGAFVLDPSGLGSAAVSIGFPFVFFGQTYTNLIVSTNGTLTLSSGNTIVPFSANLSLDYGASVSAFTDAGRNAFTVTWSSMNQPGGGADQTFQAILFRSGEIRFNYKTLGANWTNGVIKLAGATTVTGTLINSSTLSSNKVVVTNTVLTTNSFGFITGTTTKTTNWVTTTTATANGQSLLFNPGTQKIITASPLSATIQAGKTARVTLTGDARRLTSGGGLSVTNSASLSFGYGTNQTAVSAVTFIATNSVETAYPAAAAAEIQTAMWGTGAPVVSSQQNADGSRTLVWPAPGDDLPRTYTVLYTTSLSSPWKWLATVENGTRYTDQDHNAEPVIFYKVTVQ